MIAGGLIISCGKGFRLCQNRSTIILNGQRLWFKDGQTLEEEIQAENSEKTLKTNLSKDKTVACCFQICSHLYNCFIFCELIIIPSFCLHVL